MSASNLNPNTAVNNDNKPVEPAKKPACKACCACPETKLARDKW